MTSHSFEAPQGLAPATYAQRTGRPADFLVRYRFLSAAEGGRSTPPRQHVRWDFLYAGDDPLVDGVHMIWPEFVDAAGHVLPEGEVPAEGVAQMFVVNRERTAFHHPRIRVGAGGFFMEGARKVAECEVTAITWSPQP